MPIVCRKGNMAIEDVEYTLNTRFDLQLTANTNTQ